MVHFTRILTVMAVLATTGLPAIAFEGPSKGGAGAQGKSEADAAEAGSGNASPATVKAYEAGVKAYQEGKTDLAIRALGKALEGGGLETPKIAQALYYRGQSYRKKGRPGRAISDLTSAIWLKDGLNYADKQQAMSARVAAYREAGISDVPQLPSGDIVMANNVASSADSWQTSPSPAASSTTMGAIDPQFPQSPPSGPQPQSSGSSSSSGGGISGFFNSVTDGVTSLFGGGSSNSSNSSNSNDATVSTASLPPVNDAPAGAASWSGSTQVATAAPSAPAAGSGTPFVTQVATATPDRPTSAAPSGKYRLQIAAVRSRTEAENLAYRLVSEHGSELGPRAPVVDEAVIGSMGTFYRVRVGPYASSSEPQKLCGKLQASGFDCLVVTR